MMRSTPLSLRRALTMLAAAGLAVLLAGCGGGESTPEAEPAEEVVEYTVRGQIVDLPSEERPAAELTIRHEAIPSFRNEQGVVGMRAMTMPFPVAEDVSLEEIERGDVVSLRFRVRYEPETWRMLGYETVELTELPPDTELNLGEASPKSENDEGQSGG